MVRESMPTPKIKTAGDKDRLQLTANFEPAGDQAFVANGMWNKPAGTPPNALVTGELWSGGAGGGPGTGGSTPGGPATGGGR